MFGYVTINKPELKVKEFTRYQGYYCGLCQTLKKRHGKLGQLTLTYDMTFLILLLTSLYEEETKCERHGCMIHPMKKHDMLINEITEYAADMNIALSYHHFRDDWQDEKSVKGLAASGLYKRKYKKVEKKYKRQCQGIEMALQKLAECEKRNETNIDIVSRCFGELMAELMIYRQDEFEPVLRKVGFYLGKYIYLMDAYMDIEHDRKKHCYNPFLKSCQDEDFEEKTKSMLIMMMSETAKEFEKLPCLADSNILRNIIYEGVWVKYERKKNDGRSI